MKRQVAAPKLDRLTDPVQFTCASGRLAVTDPCYEPGTWCAGSLDKVAKGVWHGRAAVYLDPDDLASFDRWGQELDKRLAEGPSEAMRYVLEAEKRDLARRREAHQGRIAFLQVWHESYTREQADRDVQDDFAAYELTSIDVGVDSGQAGFFDGEPYDANWLSPTAQETFYDLACKETCAEGRPGVGIVQGMGIVSSSGYGDGGYDCFVLKREGVVLAAVIAFINDVPLDEEGAQEEREPNCCPVCGDTNISTSCGAASCGLVENHH